MSVLVGRRASSTFSFMASVLLVGYGAYRLQGFGILIPDLERFLTWQFAAIVQNHSSFERMLAVILAVLTLELPLTLAAGILQSLILGQHAGGHALDELFDTVEQRRLKWWLRTGLRRLRHSTKLSIEDAVGGKREEKSFFFHLFVLVVAEELFARWLFLGVLYKRVPFLHGDVQFFILFLVGNGLWALAHLDNFRRKEDRHPLRVAPQFVAGTFFSYVFLKYGLTAVVVTHFASNAILFATHKHQRFDSKDIVLIGAAGIYAAVSFAFIDAPIRDITAWLADEPIFPLEGWHFWDYVALGVFTPSFLAFVFGVLMYDRNNINPPAPKKEGSDDFIDTFVMGCVLGVPVLILYVNIIYGMFWVLGWWVVSVPIRILIISIVLTFDKKGTSGSSVANAFWTTLPTAYLGVCIMEALGWWYASLALLIISTALQPFYYLRRIDD